MNTMLYKGYTGHIEFDEHDRIFVGHLLGIRDVVGFHGSTVAELERAFHESVNDYLAACKKTGREPNKPYSGRVLLRIPPELHASASAAAQVAGMSSNQWAIRVLGQASAC